MGVLQLSYLENARIASSWIGGPHGWCDWDGTIGCANYNIGKWPTVEAVTEDWHAIAAAFPYLNLRAQLVPDEGEAESAVVEWQISNGAVSTVEELRDPIVRPGELSAGSLLIRFAAVDGERGVSLHRLREALRQVAGAGCG
jgi:hypothetical protein